MFVLRNDNLTLEDLKKARDALKSMGLDFEIVDSYKSVIRDEVVNSLESRINETIVKENFNKIVDSVTDKLNDSEMSVIDLDYIDAVILDELDDFKNFIKIKDWFLY